MRAVLSILILVGVVVAGGYFYLKYYRTEGGSNFRVASVERGDMSPTIEATGTLEPEEVIDIGSQVNGLITDRFVDFGSNVEAKMVLAQIDPLLYQATYDQCKAAVDKAQADLGQMKANAVLAQANLKRDDELLKKGAIAQSDYDAAFAANEVAKANVADAAAAIEQAKATLKTAEVNLGYCKITSPVKGTIVDRRVNVGQTVVSSLSASSLFLLAKDLSRIQVWASVNEADIGSIRPGVKAHFSVDAYPNETFHGVVSQVRLNATMTQNVVTYTVVVTTDNQLLDAPPAAPAAGAAPGNDSPVAETPRYKLLPYMTASLKFEIENHENVLLVPNAALRWKPAKKMIAPDVREETWAAMSRPKGDDKKPEKKRGRSAGRPADSGQNAVGSGSGPSLAANSPATNSLATSAGTANGSKSGDWMEVTKDKEGRKDAKAVAAKAAEAAKAAKAAAHQPPGQPLAPQDIAELKEHHEYGRLWTVDGGFVKPVPVEIIATDGTMTEVRARTARSSTKAMRSSTASTSPPRAATTR